MPRAQSQPQKVSPGDHGGPWTQMKGEAVLAVHQDALVLSREGCVLSRSCAFFLVSVCPGRGLSAPSGEGVRPTEGGP